MSEWPKETKFLGKGAVRIDGPAKVTGAAKYAYDMQPKGWLWGAILRSKWAAAKITSINLDKAKAAPGIRAAILAREGERQVRYYGEELAAIAGTSKEAVQDALRLIEVQATPLPFVVKEMDATKPGAPKIFEDGQNVGEAQVRENGNVEEGFAQCAAIVENTFETQVQLHHPLETHGNTVAFTPEEITVWASTQGVFSVRDGIADNMQIPQNKVRVICDYMGGGFGSKLGPGVEGALATRLSQAAGAPVKLMLTRLDESLAVGNRPSTFQKVKLGASADGTLLAYELESFGCPGFAAGGATAAGGSGATFPAPYIYKVPNTRAKQASVAINAGSSRAFRAPGHPTASFSMESMMDDLAVKLGIDPVELRVKNDPFEIRQNEYRIGAEKFGWKEKYKKPGSSTGVVRTGVGCAGATWGGGGRGTQAEVQINPDGNVEVRCGTQDIGTGARTVVAIVAAEVLGLTPDKIGVRIGDTRFPPSGGSGGSTTTPSISPAVFDACTNALNELQKVSGMSDVRGANWAAACKKIGMNPLVVQGKWREGLSSSGAGGVQFAEVEVDTETGFVNVRRILAVQDCGLIVNRLTCESQINGGIIQGIGYALYEGRVMDRETGVVLNPNLEYYKLPNGADVPPIDIVLLDMPERGVIGVGEPCHIPTAAAIANAVANAIGVRITTLPITPDKVLGALGKVPVPKTVADVDVLENAFALVRSLPATVVEEFIS
ncbi:MAG TPA: xanthine dehydrogenase family protein molybdopterin-binding subunit [Chthoniobacterales bacterium]|nr:xanthine dehydrogenase family protein molybdopterin-binding subunit [Chthoniobacterales bacterium]